jgi:hypothetical protein
LKRQRRVIVETQCFEDYFYTKQYPTEIEKMFGELEVHYCACVDKLRSQKPFTRKDSLSLTLLMFDFHLRNAAHVNETGREAIAGYHLRFGELRQLLTGAKSRKFQEGEFLQYLRDFWRLRILTCSADNAFMTSDNPSVFVAIDGAPVGVHGCVLPLTDKLTAVAFDRRVLTISNTSLTNEEAQQFDFLQAGNAVEAVYFPVGMVEDQVRLVANHLIVEKERPVTTMTRCSIRLLRLDPTRFPVFELLPV